MSRVRRRLLLIGGSVAVSFLVAEAVLRIGGVSYPSFYRADPVTGTSLRPGAFGVYEEEGRGEVIVNRDGYRGPRRDPKKPKGVERVLFLGDSFVEAKQVDFESTVGAVTERALGECLDRVEVIAFGVSGHGAGQALLDLRHRGLAYDPDVVVFFFVPGNDIRNDTKALERSETRPYFVLGDDGRLRLDDDFLDSSGYRARTAWWSSLLYDVIDHVRTVQLAVYVYNQRQREARKDRQGSGLDAQIYREPLDPEWQRAWTTTATIVSTIQRESEASGARFLLVNVADPVLAHPDDKTRERFRTKIGATDLDAPSRRLAAFEDVIDLGPPMRARALADGTYFYGFENTALGTGHWNEAGHAFAGELVAKAICARLSEARP